MKNEIDIVEVLDKIDDYSRTLKGVAALLGDMQAADGDGVHIYSHLRFHLLGRVVFDVIKNMEQLYKEIEQYK